MDPISTFQLASSIISVVDIGARILSDASQAYQSGSGLVPRLEELKRLPEELSTAANRVQNYLGNIPSAPTELNSILLNQSRRCIEVSNELQKIIDELQPKTESNSKFAAASRSVAAATKTMLRSSRIAALVNELTELRSQMTLTIVLQVWEKRLHDSENQQERRIGHPPRNIILRNQVDEIVKHMASLDKSLDQLIDGASSEVPEEKFGLSSQKDVLVDILWNMDGEIWAEISKNTTQSRQDHTNAKVAPAAAATLRDLSFIEMDSREKTIRKAHADTLGWIFNDEETDKNGKELEWPSFPKWLREARGAIYWITGKPGSGKSTLMKKIFEHDKLHTYLLGYSGDLPIVTAGFFFWNPGPTVQKSFKGLLRSILYQCLGARRDLIPVVLPKRWAFRNIFGDNVGCPDWDFEELKESFEILCSCCHGKAFRLALFIDGLDEFEATGHSLDDLTSWVRDISARHGIKICVSSRPWDNLFFAFEDCRFLTMQDLTSRDITRYVFAEFNAHPYFRTFQGTFGAGDCNRLLEDIVVKAQGVFLWVDLVVRSLKASMSDTSLISLKRQLDETPSDIMDLYDSIWKTVPPEKSSNASKIFQLYRAQGGDSTALTFWLAYHGPETRRTIHLNLRLRKTIPTAVTVLLSSNTRGICELHSDRVVLLHRSASDWMTQKWPSICAAAPADFEPNFELLDAFLVAVPLPDCPNRRDLFQFVQSCFGRLHAIPFPKGTNKINDKELVQALDKLNRHACSIVKAGCRVNRISHSLAESVNIDDVDHRFSGAGWPTLVLGENMTHIEFSFVGTAASAGCASYVRAKVDADKSLLEPKKGRVSVLENAIFPHLGTIWDSRHSDASFLPKLEETTRQREEIIRFLLARAGRKKYETLLGDSMYDAVHAAQKQELPGKLDRPEWYGEILQLLRDHGYRPTWSGYVATRHLKEERSWATRPEKRRWW